MSASRSASRITRRRASIPASVPLTAVTLVAVALLAAACSGASAPDLVIRHAKVFTNDTARPWAEAVAIKGERVVAVGDDAAIGALAGVSTRVIDAGGRVLVPGFNDARVDLPLRPPTPQDLTTLDREAITRGVTSLQVVAGGRMQSLVVAAQQAQRAARWRLIRSPEDTESLDVATMAATPKVDEKPFLPPQPGVRLVANGVHWALAPLQQRQPISADRVATVLGWAYGAEDPIVIATGGSTSVLGTLARIGLPDVWKRKRPRLDALSEIDPAAAPSFASHGVVLAVVPARLYVANERGLVPDDAVPPRLTWMMWSPRPFLAAGVVVATGSGGQQSMTEALATLAGEQPWLGGATGPPALARDAAVRAMTWGSAYAEKAERDKGWLGPGTLADLAVLSDDIFTVSADRLPAISSVLTLVGGTIVYDPGVLTSR